MSDVEDFVRKVRDLFKTDLKKILKMKCINKIGFLSIDQTVVKIDKTIKIIVDIVNSVRIDVQLSDNSYQTRKFVVLKMKNRSFVDENDFDAFVILSNDAFVDMIVDDDTKCNFTFVTSIEVIFSDIQIRTK